MDHAQRRFRIVRVALPCAVAFIQLIGTAGTAHWRGFVVPPGAWAILLLSAALLAFAPRRPAAVLGAETVLAGVYAFAGFPPGPAYLAFLIALFHAAFRGRRWQAWTVVGLGTAVVLAGDVGRLTGWWTGILVSDGAPPFLLGAVVLGEAARRRRERIGELREQRLARRQAERDEYRLTLARDIHDVVGHSLSLINVQASVALHLGAKDPERLIAALEDIKKASKDSLTEVRELLDVLREPGDSPRTPARVLRRAVDLGLLIEEARDGGLRVTLTPSAGVQQWAAPLEALDDAGRDALFRAVQEALSNVRRHAAHPEAELRLERRPGEVALECLNPADGGPAGEGHGLSGMRERVTACGGALEAEVADGAFRLLVTLPVKEASRD
ncbi:MULTISPECIES: histidine kinase [Arthrobacter]|uniref:histidine kinase n=2 Tax=Arthrobacter TaxID=1663 RepID=A0ABU9KPM8_9MICC|nr:histidine kinase [Arthrobacter sp. YJM1]MDP5227457.1 histidine kinase [Arthrobacter sp. YJM1]